MYPSIQKKIVDELFQVLGNDNNRDLTFDDLHQLKYLEMCIKDILRLFPIAPFLMRISSTDFQLGIHMKSQFKVNSEHSLIE